MSTTNETTNEVVLVTGAGTPAGAAVIRSLVGRVEVVAVDTDPAAPALRLATCGAVVPPPTSVGYAHAIAQVAVATGATVLVPTQPDELAALAAGAADLDHAGLRTWLPAAEAVDACLDLLRFAEVMERAGLAHPATAAGSPANGDGPWVVSPRVRTGASAVLLVDDPAEAQLLAERLDGPVFQQVVPGRGFCADLVATETGLAGGVSRWRVAADDGANDTPVPAAVLDACTAAVASVGLVGAAAVRGVVTPAGQVVVTEIEPRFSNDLATIGSAGADLIETYVAMVVDHAAARRATAVRVAGDRR